MLSESVSCSVVSYSLQPCGLQPTRPLCPWNSPSKNTGVACYSLLHGCLYNQLQLCVETSASLGMEEILAVKFQINLNLIFVPGSQILCTNRIWEITKEKRIGESCKLASNFPHCVFPYENMCSPWVSKCWTRLSN